MTDRIPKDRPISPSTLNINPTKKTFGPDTKITSKELNLMSKPTNQQKEKINIAEPNRQFKNKESASQPEAPPRQENNTITKNKSFKQINSKSLRISAAAEHEKRRPLVIIQTNEPDHSGKNEDYKIGYDFLQDQAKISKNRMMSFDSRSLYIKNSMKIGVFFGKNNQLYGETSGQMLRNIDPEGILLHSILKVNEKTTYRPDVLCSIALIAASLAVGHFGSIEEKDAKHLVNILSPKDKQDALDLALIASSQGSFNNLAEVLLIWGAKTEAASDDDGSMPLEIAIEHQNLPLARLLIENGADPDIELVSGITCRDMVNDQKLLEFQKLFN